VCICVSCVSVVDVHVSVCNTNALTSTRLTVPQTRTTNLTLEHTHALTSTHLHLQTHTLAHTFTHISTSLTHLHLYTLRSILQRDEWFLYDLDGRLDDEQVCVGV